MVLFPNVRPINMLKALFPFVVCVIAAILLIMGYSRFTSDLSSRIHLANRSMALDLVKGLVSVSMDPDALDDMFMTDSEDLPGALTLSPELLRSFRITSFRIYPLPELSADGFPEAEISTAAAALAGMEPQVEYGKVDKTDLLLIYYPIEDYYGAEAVVRAEITGILSVDQILGNRWGFFVFVAGVLLILLIPAAFLKLAEIRRQIEQTGFYQSITDIDREHVDNVQTERCPVSLLDGPEFPAVLRLGPLGEVLYLNRSAEDLLDLSLEDAEGIKFHELPCVSFPEGSGMNYPDETEVLKIDITHSSGKTSAVRARVEKMKVSGYAVSIRIPGSVFEDADTGSSESPAEWSEADAEIEKIRRMLAGTRLRYQGKKDLLSLLDSISRTLEEGETQHDEDNDSFAGTIELFSELDSISSTMNDVLPKRASVDIDCPGFLPEVEYSRVDLTQLVKNLVFYSLESNEGPVRILISAREVVSPVNDTVFSSTCDRTVPRSVALGYTDGTRMPVVLKEALIDPETDLAGIQRDFGVHISSVARVLAKMECHPVFTEGASGTTLNLLFRTSEDFLFDSYGSRSGTSPDLSGLKLIHCEGSRIVRESVAEALKNHGLDVLEASSLQEALEVMQSHGSQLLLLDSSLIPEPVEESLEEFLTDHPSLVMILTRTAASVQIPIPARYSENVRLLEKPYSMDQLLNIFETMTETGGQEGDR